MAKSQTLEHIRDALAAFKGGATVEEVGRVTEVGDGVARLSGLKNVMVSEMIEFLDDEGRAVADGVALNVEEFSVGAIVLGSSTAIREGSLARRKETLLSVGASEEMVGRVVSPLGEPIDGAGALPSGAVRQPLERVAPGVITRQAVNTPLQTGIKAIDAMIPIGRGQRELIIGDRGTGKTALAIDAIINQKDQGVICIYVAIGQKESKVAKTVAKLRDAGALAHTIVVVAAAGGGAALQFIAPYAGAAIGEYFMAKGKDVLVVYDDLSKHAWAYREIALLLRRPPGREAYPGDIFYLHSRLLERAARLAKEYGGGSLTALPIIETQQGDVSAYIPTNVISITDGQIYLESDLFYRGVRPAVNVGLSVSRVGGAAQIKAMKKVAGRLRLDLAQFRELEAFAQFASDLDEKTRAQIERGRRLVEVLKQRQFEPMPVENQVAILYAAVNGHLDDVAVEDVGEFERGFHAHLGRGGGTVLARLKAEKDITPEVETGLKEAIEAFKKVESRK
ncbi:MAG: F0F1 ATP synthase subunit alpha [bacterium]|nr:F0F1 ATP synthase subunit alpha [bacterium]MDZ4284912.1 F0F1 ATP synthase subunit alpha [Patescibacteria group bacterium]